jgi:ParB/RepB/Spo0J family partition protein
VSLAAIRRELRELPIGVIDEPALASRSAMDEQKLDELTESIRSLGLIMPLSVAPHGERYEVIAGHRRRLACARAGLLLVPCIVYPSKDAALEAIKYAENRFREELSPADEAIWFAELLERDAAGDVDTLCAQLGEKRGYVEGRLLLLTGDEEIFRALERGEIGVGVAQQLNRCAEQAHRRMLLYQARTGGATVAVVSGWIAEWKQIHAPANANVVLPAPLATGAPVAMTTFFTCALCGKDDNVHLMQPVNFHTYCRQAIFADMLALWNRRHEYARTPRTLDEAVELVNELIERFPQLLESDPRRI